MKIINPATEEIIREVSQDSPESLKKKFLTLKNGQINWKNTPVDDRLEKIAEFGNLVKIDIERLAKILTQETGKPIQQSRNEIKGAHNRIEHLQNEAKKWLLPEMGHVDPMIREAIFYEPLGVIGNISAWNYPYNVGYNVFLYALAAGNSVLYKPSEYATLTGLAIAEHLYQSGIPESVFQVAVGDGEIGRRLLTLDLDGYFFTGSYGTGRKIAVKVAQKLVPVQLELGGKDPLYVMEDVENVRQAAINAAEGSFYNAGQSCCAVERIYVSEKIYDDFVKYFIQEVSDYKVGNPIDENTFIGPLTRSQQIKVLREQIEDAKRKGAEVLTGGHRIEGPGNFFEPTVLTGVNHTMRVMKEETFGPLIGIQKVSSDEEAISLMNDTSFGLTAAVFGSEEKRALSILNQMNTGTVYWNCCDRVSPYVPWSGRKNSGLGSTLSYQGIRAFVQPKAYHLKLK